MAGDERALELAFRYLGKRDRTEAEVRRHLAGREIDEPRSTTRHRGDRAAWATSTTRAMRARSPRTAATSTAGGRADRAQAARHSASIPSTWRPALGARDGAGELEAALELLRRRVREVPASERERERALGMLVRKGYDLEVAYGAVRAFERAAVA